MRRLRWCGLGLLLALVGCGDTPVTDLGATSSVAGATARRDAVPPTRADERRWPRAPRQLRAALNRRVLVAGTATGDAMSHTACGVARREKVEFVNGRIDEFALTLTFRLISSAGQTEGEPVVQRCTGRWGARSARWHAADCAHYAPAWSLRTVMRSGGGFTHCAFRRTPPLVMAWVVPPRGARWIVVRRSTGYDVAYPVTRREPINVTHLRRDVRWVQYPARARFPYAIVDRDGDVRRTSFLAAVAG